MKAKELFFLIYFLITYPFWKLYNFIEKIDSKPRIALNVFLVITAISLFPNFIKTLIPSVSPWFLLSLLVTFFVYIIKYTDKQYGQFWKSYYKEFEKNKKWRIGK